MDSSNVASLQMTVMNEPAGSEIIAPSVDGIVMDSVLDSTGRLITYTGEQPIATYQDILQLIRYINTEDEPMPGSVQFLVQVFTPSETSGQTLPSNVAEVTVDIIPLNDNDPVFSEANYTGAVYENAPSGTSTLVTVQASDSDIYSSTSITYAIAGGRNEFTIDATSGSIFTTQPLDAETTTYHQFIVIASDNDGTVPRSSNAFVEILVLDVNDNSPVFELTQYLANVTENTASGQLVITVVASDDDITLENDVVMYQLELPLDEASGSGDLTPLPPQQDVPFVINMLTGDITVAEGAVIDFEAVTEYSLVVVAANGGAPRIFSSVEITIVIENENDEAPQFTQELYNGSVAEDAQLGTFILTVLATDADSADISYTIEGTELIEVDSVTGIVSLAQPLDFSITPVLSAMVVANDNGSPPLVGRASLLIEVININNNVPRFSEDNYTFTVLEGMPLQEHVIATDADGDSVVYIPVEGFDDVFTLDSTSGVISTVPGFQFDYETRQEYTLVVVATDGRFNSTVSVTVEVEDANDNAPSFRSATYSATLPETSDPGTFVVRVEAEDRDIGSNADIVYAILNEDLFEINEQNGIITLARQLDFEANSGPFMFTVVARNSEPPFWNDTAVVTVSVSDSNDNHPILTLDILGYRYVENSPPLSLASDLSITDEDTSIHLLSRCQVTLNRGSCQQTDSELSSVCGSNTDCIAQCAEEIAVNISLVASAALELTSVVSSMSQSLVVSGNASEADYQAVLSSLTYFNRAAEPAAGARSVLLQCEDAGLVSNTLQISVEVALINDNPIMLEAETQRLVFVEGDNTVAIGEEAGLRLIDLDVDPMVAWMRVVLVNPRDSVRERLSVDSGSVNVGSDVESGLEILINQTSSLVNYQVRSYNESI